MMAYTENLQVEYLFLEFLIYPREIVSWLWACFWLPIGSVLDMSSGEAILLEVMFKTQSGDGMG
jgi:hypothetical protein